MLATTLPAYVKGLGGTNSQVGLVISLFALAALISRPIGGAALDKLGRKYILTVAILFLIFITLGFSYFSIVIPILVLRFVHSLFWGLCSTSIATLTTDITPKELRTQGLGYYALSMSIALAAVPGIGILLMNKFSFKWMI